MKKPTKKAVEKPEFPKVIETYGKPYIPSQGKDEPSCFNGFVSVERYRITIEKIEEPKEIIAERLLKLWRTCDNHHHLHPLQSVAASFGLQLNWEEYGKDRKP